MDELLKFKAENKQATLDINQALKQSKDLEILKKVNANKEEQQKELTRDNISIPLEVANQIGEKKHETFRDLDKRTDFQIFQNNIDAQQAKETNQLKAQQAQETLLYKYDDTYNSDILAPIFSTEQEPHLNRVSRAIKADKAYDYASNVSIPTELKHSNQMVDLKLQQANSKALAINNFIKKQINDEFQYMKDNYKDYAIAYVKEYNRLGVIGDEALQEAYAKAYELTTNNYAEMTQTNGPLDNIIRGVIHTADGWASLGASLSASLREGTLTFKDAPILEKFLESAFGYKSYNKYEAFGTASVIQDNVMNTLRLLPVANAISTFAESLPEMLELGIMGSGFAKGWNKTVLDARNALIAEKTLTKNMSKHIDRQIKLADFKGNTQLKERLEALKLHLTNPAAKTITKDEFSSIAGAVASTFNKVSFWKGLRNAGPLPFTLLALEYAKRGVDLYKDKPEGYQLTWWDSMAPLIHLFVDYAGIVGMLGAKNVFVGARNSLYNKQEIARLSAKETLTKVEKDTLDFLKQANKAKIGDGLRGSILGGFAIEGFGEMIQTHLEQQVQSGYTLPSFTDMLFNEYNLSSLREKQEDMYRTGMLGGLGGALAGGVSNITGNVLRKADETISEYLKNKNEKEAKEILNNMPQAAEFNDDYYKQYISDTFESQFKRLNMFDDKTNSTSNESASEFSKKQKEIFEEGKKLEQTIREEEKKIGNSDISLRTNNNERIEQLEHASNILAKKIKDGNELSKELLDKKVEEKNTVDKLIKAYQDLDELTTSSMLSTGLLARIDNDLNSEVKEKQIKLLTEVANAKNKEERDKALTAFLENVDIEVEKIGQTIKDFMANKDAQHTNKTIGTLTSANSSTPSGANVFNSEQKGGSFNSKEDNTITEPNYSVINTQGQQQDAQSAEPTEQTQKDKQSKDTEEQVKDKPAEDTITQQNIDEANALNSKSKKAIKDYLMSLDPEVAAFLLLEDHTKISSRQKVPNKAFEEYKKSKALVRIPIEDLDEDSNARLTDDKTKDKDRLIHTRKEEAIMVPIRYYNPATRRTESISSKDAKTGDLQSSLRTLASVRSNIFSDRINDIIKSIQDGNINEASKAVVEKGIEHIQSDFEKTLESVKSKALFIQKILALTTNKKLQTILKRSLNNTSRELDRIHKDVKRLNDIINENKSIIDKTIKAEYQNQDIDGETALLQSLTDTTSKMFSGIKNRIKNFFNLKEVSAINAERTKLRKILYHLRQIFNKMTDYFNSEEYQKLYNDTKAILDTHKDFFNLPTDTEYYLNFNRNGINYSRRINGLYYSMFKETFATLLYDFYGVKPEVSSKEVLLDYLIRLGLNKEGYKSQYVSMFEPLLRKIKINIGQIDKKEASIRAMQQGSQSIFNKEYTLFDLLVPNPDSINKIFTRDEINRILSAIDSNKKISTTDTILSEQDTALLTDNLDVFKHKIADLINNDKAIKETLLLAIDSNSEIAKELDMFLELGLVIQTSVFAKSSDIRDNKDLMNRIGENKRKELSDEQGVVIATNSQERMVRKFIADYLNQTVGQDFLDTETEQDVNDEIINAVYEISSSLANTYIMSKNFKSNTTMYQKDEYQVLDSQFHQEIQHEFKEIIEEFAELINQDNYETNDVEAMAKMIGKLKSIPDSIRKALVQNLQHTGTIFNDSSSDKFIDMISNDTNGVNTFDKLKEEYYKAINNSDGQFDADNVIITRKRYNEILNKFMTNAETREAALLNDNSHNNPLNYQRKVVYVEKNGMYYKTFEYVYIKNVTTLANESLCNQILPDNMTKESLINGLSNPESINSILSAIEERQTQIGDVMFKLMNRDMNLNNTKVDENIKKSLYSPVDYSKAVYYFYDLMPNGRVGMKASGQVMDNKLIREISKQIIPDEIQVFKNGNLVWEKNKAKLPFNGKENKPNTLEDLLANKSKGFVFDNFKSNEDKNIYLGILYSFARAFGQDVEKFKLPEQTEKMLKDNISGSHYQIYYKLITDKKNLQNQIAMLKGKAKDNKLSKQEQKDLNKLEKDLDKKELALKQIVGKIDVTKFHYEYNGENLNELLADLASNKDGSVDRFNKLVQKIKKELKDKSYFSEHIGMALNNIEVFEKAIKNGKFNLKDLETQNLLVYIDGAATFMMENNVRGKSILPADAISGVFKYNDLVEASGMVDYILIRGHINKLAQDLNISNKDAKDAYLEILKNKGIDIYTLSIGTTIMSLEPFNNISLLTNIFTNSSILSRDFMKKLIQPTAYNAGVRSRLEKLKEISQIPLDLALTHTTRTFIKKHLTLIQDFNKSTNEKRPEYLAQIREKFLENIREDIEQLKNDIQQTNDKKLKQESIYKKEILEGFAFYLNRHPLTTLDDILSLNAMNDNGGYANVFSKITENSSIKSDIAFDYNLLHSNISKMLDNEINTIVRYYENFDATHKLNSNNIYNGINILNTFNNNDTIKNSQYITKGKANEILFRSLTEDMLFEKGKKESKFIKINPENNKEKGITEYKVSLTKNKTDIESLKNKLSEIFKNSEITLDDTEWEIIVLNVIQHYQDTEGKSFLPNHKPLALKANPILVMTQQNNRRLVEQKNILQRRVNDMFVLAMIDIIKESLPKKFIGSEEKIDLEQIYNQDKEFANRFNRNKDKFISNLKEQFLQEAFYDDVYIPLFKHSPDSAQRAEYVHSMNEFFETLTRGLEAENIRNAMFKNLATIDNIMLHITRGKGHETTIISSDKFIFPDVIGLFNHNLEGSVISYTNSPLFQIFDALVGNANNIEQLRSDGWNGGFSQSHRATDSAFIMNKFMNKLPNTFDKALGKVISNHMSINNKYDINSMSEVSVIMETLRLLELQIKSFVEISEFKQPIVKNIPSIMPSNEIENNQFDSKLRGAYIEAVKTYKTLVDKLDTLEQQKIEKATKAKESLKNNKDYNVLGEEEFNLYNVLKASKPTDELWRTLSNRYGNGLVRAALKFFLDTFKSSGLESRPKDIFLGNIINYITQIILKNNTGKLQRNYQRLKKNSNTETLISNEVSTLLNTKIELNSNNQAKLSKIIQDIYGQDNIYFNLFVNDNNQTDIQELAEYVSINSIKYHLTNLVNNMPEKDLNIEQKKQINEKINNIKNMNQLISQLIDGSKITIQYGNEFIQLDLPSNWATTEEQIVLNAIEELEVFDSSLDAISKKIKQNADEGKISYLSSNETNPDKMTSYSSLFFNNSETLYDTQFSNELMNLLDRKKKIDKQAIDTTINTVRNNISIFLGIPKDDKGKFTRSYNANKDSGIYDIDGQEEYTAEQYLDQVNDDIDIMIQEESNINGQNITDELNNLKEMVNDLSKNLRDNFKALQNNLHTQRKGNFSMEIDDKGNTVTNTITIDGSANRYTRLHELFHALTSFGAIANNNRAKILLNKINQLRIRTKQYLDANPSLINELELDYEHIFETEDVLKGVQEFLATFLSEPKLIAFLANLNTKDLNLQDNGKLEGKTLIGKGLNLIKSLIKYTTELVKHKFKAPQSALEVLTQATRELSSMNTQEGEKALKAEYENKITTRINRALVTRIANVLSKDFGKFLDRNPEVLKPGETLEQAKMRFENEVMNDKNVNETLKRLHKRIADIKKIETPRQKTISTAIYLLETAFLSRRKLRSFLRDNPVKVKYVRERLADLRHMLIEGTIFDMKVHLDFGLRPNDFLKNSINMVNRALSSRNAINGEIEIAAINTQKMTEAYMFNTPEFNEYFKSKEKREQYSVGMFKLIVGQNLGDYFFNQDKISQTDLNDLFHYQFYAENDEIKSVINANVNAGLDLMNIYEEDKRKVIKRFIVDLAYTRITGKRNKFGNQNIELLFKQLGFKDNQYNAEAMRHFHKAITLQAILTPKMMEDIGNEDIIHFNNQIQIVKNTFYNNIDFQDSMKESFMNLVSLHKDMLQKVYTQKILNLGEAHKFYTDNQNKTELYFDEHQELYKTASKFAYNSFDAYYDDAYQFLSYNQDIVNVAINPEDYGVGEEGEKAFKKAQSQYEKMGFKQIHITDNGTIIYQYDGIIDYTQHKDRLGFMFRPLNHQGQAFYSMSEQDMSDEYLKEDIREHQQMITEQALLDYGNEIQGTDVLNTFPEFGSFSGLTKYKSLAGSETITRENISNKQFEEWVKPDLRLEKSFYQMAQISQENKIRDLNNNQIYYQIIKSDEYIKNNRLKNTKTNKYHHTEVLFYYDNGRFTFNKELTDKYGFSLSRLDEKDFAQMALAMNYDSTFKKGERGEVYIDTRIMPMLFSFNKIHLGKMAGLINENFTKEKNPAMYKALSGFQTILRGLVKETRNNTIIRNPNLVLVNFKSNILGLIGEGIPLKDIVQSLPFYIRELQKYHKDMKEKIRIENELAQLNKKEFRSNTNMTIEEQIELKNKLKKEEEDINNAIARNSVTPLMEQGLYSNVIEDAETTGFKWDNWVAEKFGEKTGKDSYVDYVKEAFMTEDSDTYKLLAEWTRIGDFAPRAILYYHLIGKLGYSKEKALDETRERFINYNTPMFSPVMRALDYLGIVNYTKYKFNVQYQAIRAFANAPVQATTLLSLDTALKSIGIPKALTLDNYLAESFLVDGNIPSGFWNMGLDYLKGVWRWNYVIP